MRTIVSFTLAAVFCLAIGARSAVGESRWNNTSGGTFDWNSSGNWSGSFPPGSADDVRITNDLVSAQLITNMGGSTAIGGTNKINFLAISNGLGNASITVQQAPGVFWQSSFGFQLGKNSTLILVTNSIIGTNSAVTFNLRAGGQAGTLILSNASATSGFSTFLNSGGGSVSNAGTIQFSPNGGQLISFNYGQTAGFTNNTQGTIVMTGTGTGSFTGNFVNNNKSVVNNGSIFVRAGTLRIDSRNAFSLGGFQNNGYVQVDTNAVFEIRRSTNAWVAGTASTNTGTIFLNGGNVVAFDEVDQTGTAIGTNVARFIVNTGTIQGSGAISASLSNLSGSVLAPGLGFGTLNVGGNVVLGSNSTLSIQLGLLAGQNDLLNVSSNLTLNANSILSLAGGAVGNVYTVAVALAVSGTFGTVTPSYIVNYDPADITVQFIPEPSTLFLVALGLTGMIAVRRRKK